MYEQVHHKQQTAQMAELTAHKERRRWQLEGGPPPLHSHYGQVPCPPLPPPPPPCRPPPASTMSYRLFLWRASHWANIRCAVAPPPNVIGAMQRAQCSCAQCSCAQCSCAQCSVLVCLPRVPSHPAFNCTGSQAWLSGNQPCFNQLVKFFFFFFMAVCVACYVWRAMHPYA